MGWGWEKEDVERHNRRLKEQRAWVAGGGVSSVPDSPPVADEKKPAAELLAEVLCEEKKESKYHARGIWLDGFYFPSRKEARYYEYLKQLAVAGEVEWFCVQPVFIVCVGTDRNHRAITYKADFIVKWKEGTEEPIRVVDTKGVETQVFKNKMKMLRAKFPKLEIRKE